VSRGRAGYRAKGELIRALREARFKSPHELADETGISEATIRRIESGKTPSPHRSQIRKLADYFGVKPEDLVEVEGPFLVQHLRYLARAS
jgi:transcriptional regulator with XRE-family HTH domain